MNVPPAPAPFINLRALPLISAAVRWAPGAPPASPPAAIVDLGGAQVFVYSEAQAADLVVAFAEAGRMHREAGGQR